jgi:hypothetical protein
VFDLDRGRMTLRPIVNPGPVEHDAKIVAFTATPKDPTKNMHVHPQSGLQIQIRDTGIVGFDIEALDLIRMLHGHVRHAVIGRWFEYGLLPERVIPRAS